MDNKLKDFSWLNISNGIITIEPYKKIREDIIEMMQEVYEIDEIIENSADYIFASNIALSIWNLMNLIEKSYEQHNVDFAQGVYLDKIMSYYGKYRNTKKAYVLDVELEGSDHRNFNADNLLFNFNDPSQEFNYIREVQVKDNSTIYRVRAKGFYEGLTFNKVKNLDLRSRTGNIYTSETPNINIINFQEKEESDVEFKQRFNYEFTSNLESLLKKNEFIKKINILNPGDTLKNVFSNEVDTNKIKNGQTCIILEMTNEYFTLNEEDKKSVNVDIDIIISEYLNLGTETIRMPQYLLSEDQRNVNRSKELNNYFDIISQRSPKNDFIEQNITFNVLKNNYGYIEFEVFNNDDIENRIEDVMMLLNKKPTFYQYNKIDLLYTLERLLEVNKSKPIKWGYSQSDIHTKLSLNGDNWQNNDEIDTNAFTKSDILLNKWIIYGNEADNNYDLPTKLNFTQYKYKEQSDGTIKILIF